MSEDVEHGLRVPRFRPVPDWYVSQDRGALHELFAWSNAERIVNVLHALTAHLDPAVDLTMQFGRDGVTWHGQLLPLPDVREALGRLQSPLATYGGVEVSVYTPDDQLTLTGALGLVIYARSDRWVHLLDGMGFAPRAVAPEPLWNAETAPLGASPELDRALALVVEQLGLERRGPEPLNLDQD